MSIAAAPTYEDVTNHALSDDQGDSQGAQSLLQSTPARPHYPAQVGAVLLYAIILGALVTLTFRTAEKIAEEEQVIELAPMPVQEEPPPQDELPPPETMEIPELPPPPAVIDPVAPVEEKPKPPPQPAKPKTEKVAPKPNAAPRTTGAPAVAAPAAPPGAAASAIANHFHACMQRAAANAYPESQAPRTARIAYRATFSASGQMTAYSITPSGNGAFDAVANRLGGRCGSVPSPGKPVALSGALTFSP